MEIRCLFLVLGISVLALAARPEVKGLDLSGNIPDPALEAKDPNSPEAEDLGDVATLDAGSDSLSSRCSDDDECLQDAWAKMAGGHNNHWQCKDHKKLCKQKHPFFSYLRSCCPQTCNEGPEYTCNSAMCAGENQPTHPIRGSLSCAPSQPSQYIGDGKDCPDTLSKLKFYAKFPMFYTSNGSAVPNELIPAGSDGACVDYTSDYSIKRIAVANTDNTFITKATVIHPNSGHVNVGWLALKRLVCDAEADEKGEKQCDVYKNFACIRCPHEVFPTGRGVQTTNNRQDLSNAVLTTDDELRNFVTSCAQHAWDNPGTSDARIKESYECEQEDIDTGMPEMLAF